jgi:hypothetical protein
MSTQAAFKLLTPPQLAQQLGVATITISRAIAAGKIEPDCVAGNYRLFCGDRVPEIREKLSVKPKHSTQ